MKLKNASKITLRRFLLGLCLLLCSATYTYAAQCPSYFDWSHVKGQEWQLSAKAQQEGWQASTLPGAIDSELTTLPAMTSVLIGVSATSHRFTTCGYALQPGDHSQVVAAINTKDAVNVKTLKPPFYCRKGRCFCSSTAAQPELCPWDWKS